MGLPVFYLFDQRGIHPLLCGVIAEVIDQVGAQRVYAEDVEPVAALDEQGGFDLVGLVRRVQPLEHILRGEADIRAVIVLIAVVNTDDAVQYVKFKQAFIRLLQFRHEEGINRLIGCVKGAGARGNGGGDAVRIQPPGGEVLHDI